jgi:hypothetical protein
MKKSSVSGRYRLKIRKERGDPDYIRRSLGERGNYFSLTRSATLDYFCPPRISTVAFGHRFITLIDV